MYAYDLFSSTTSLYSPNSFLPYHRTFMLQDYSSDLEGIKGIFL